MRLKKYNQGGKPSLSKFEKAFAEAKRARKETFIFDGKEYHTRTAEEEFAKYIQPGSKENQITDHFLNSPEAIAERERQRKAQEAWDWQVRSSGRLAPIEGFNDPIFNFLLGGRTISRGIAATPRILQDIATTHNPFTKNRFFKQMQRDAILGNKYRPGIFPSLYKSELGEAPWLKREVKEKLK